LLRRIAEAICVDQLLEGLKARALCACVLAIVAGCVPLQQRASPLQLTPEQEKAALAALLHYRFEGRVAVTTGSDGFNASLQWNQNGDATDVQLSGPFGAGGLRVTLVNHELRIDSSKGERLSGDDARNVLEQKLGFAPPIESLRYWLLGLRDPAGTAIETRDDNGRIASIDQNGWHVDYEAYRSQPTPVGTLSLPRRLRATRDALKLRVVADKWVLSQ
jgi:outer membrane lipoprotein LolB